MKGSSNTVQNYGFFAVLLAAFLWGTTGTVASFAPNLSPLTIGAAAMGGGGLLQALLARKNILNQLANIRPNLGMLFIGILSVAIYPLAFYSSMNLAGITIGTVISIGTAPLFTALLERFFDNKKLSIHWFIAFLFGIIGVILLSIGESNSNINQNDADPNNKIIGIVLGALAGLTYSIYSWAAKKLIDNGIDAKASMGLIFGLGAFILLPIFFYTGENLLNEKINIYVVAYMMFIPMFLGYVLFGYGLKTLPASKAITLTLFEPVVAAILAIALVGEKLAEVGWLGMILIFICLIILIRND